jgi:predicted Zn-ribbon and HTH transcriptional regulator
MGKFYCKECRYIFETKHGYHPKRCPYCGKDKIEEEKDAETLIKEVEEILK